MLSKLIKHLTRKQFRARGARNRRLRRVGRNREQCNGLRFESLEERALLASLTLSVSGGITSVTEGRELTFAVTLDDAVSAPFTVDVTLNEVTATGGAAPLAYPRDYDNVVAQLSFDGKAGEMHEFTVATLDDSVVELAETFTVSLTASDALIDDSDTFTGTITDNDHATLSVGNATAVEGDEGTTMLSFPVTLSAAVDLDVSVDYTTQDVTASASDGDYVAITTPTALNINAGETSGTINITVNGDATVESNETLLVLLSNLRAFDRNVTLASTEWVPLGNEIEGQVAGERLGEVVSLSDDGHTVAIGAGYNRDKGRVYRFDGTDWKQLGLDLAGDAEDGYSPSASISLSGDGRTVAIGAQRSNDNLPVSGRTRVYRFDGTAWNQLGQNIVGEAAGDFSGFAVGLSDDGNTVIIGAWGNDDNGERAGHARIYRFDDTSWKQLGEDIDGEAAGDYSGSAVSISSDGSTVAIGAPANDDNGDNAGQCRIYRFDGTRWNQLGQDIDGDRSGAGSGRTVSLSDDGDTIVIGGRTDAIYDGGEVQAYRFDGTGWVQIGQTIKSTRSSVEFGFSVSVSDDGTTLLSGAPHDSGSADTSGLARAYRFDGNVWKQLGQDILGETASDYSGTSVSLSGDGMTAVIGAPRNEGTGNVAGNVRAYQLGPAATGKILNDDRSILTVDDVTVTEGGGVTFSVVSSNAVQLGFSVGVTLADVTAVGGYAGPSSLYPYDYNKPVARLYFNGDAGETQQFTVDTVDDAIVEGAETFTVRLLPRGYVPDAITLIDYSDTGTGTIIDNDDSTLSVGRATVTEGHAGITMLSFPVSLSATVDMAVSVDYTTQDGTATAGEGDYLAVTTPATLTLSAGATRGMIDIAVTGDTIVEADETLRLMLSNLRSNRAGVTFAEPDPFAPLQARATGTITNDDRATFSVGDASVTEGNVGTTLLSFPVTLDMAVDIDISVDYITQDDHAGRSRRTAPPTRPTAITCP